MVRLWLSGLYYSAGQWEEARRNLSTAVDLDTQLLTQTAKITTLWCNMALHRRVADPERFVDDVLDHLPANALALRPCRPYILNRLYIQLALQSYGRGEIPHAQRHLSRALSWDGVSPLAEAFGKLLAYAALHLPVDDPIGYVDLVLSNLPPRARHLRRSRTGTLNRTHIALAREASLEGARRLVIGHTLHALLYQPHSVRTWKEAVMFGGWLANTARSANTKRSANRERSSDYQGSASR
jgi:hypothetical protein